MKNTIKKMTIVLGLTVLFAVSCGVTPVKDEVNETQSTITTPTETPTDTNTLENPSTETKTDESKQNLPTTPTVPSK